MRVGRGSLFLRYNKNTINGDESAPTIDDVVALSFNGSATPLPASGDGALFTPTGIEAGTRGGSLARKDNAI